MILKFENVVTKTSFGKFILQLDRDKIICVEPRDLLKANRISCDPPPTGWYGEGSFSNIVRFFVDIKCMDEIFEIEFMDDLYRSNVIDYIMDEMSLPIMPLQENKFYKKSYKKTMESAMERAVESVKTRPTRKTGRKTID